MKYVVLAILWLATSGAHGQEDPFLGDKPEETAVQEDDTFKVFPDPAGKEYFPKDRASYYTRYLSAMKEPSVKAPLAEGVAGVFRFTYLRSFHDPLVVRIVDKGEDLTMTAIRLKMDREYRPVKIIHDETWNLDPESTKTVRGLLTQKDFLKPLNGTEEALASGGLDGSRWIFELHDKDGYRMLDIWSPDALAMPEEELKQAGLDSKKMALQQNLWANFGSGKSPSV
jgi:hypothetical protein